MRELILSLFPGLDLFGRAFEQEGFCVVKGPDILFGQDVRDWHVPAGRFDGVIGGPPCQLHSQAIVSSGGSTAAEQGNLIPEFERIVEEAQPTWWLMENVPEAPFAKGANWAKELDAWMFGASQYRKRRFCSNLILNPIVTPINDRHKFPWPTVMATEYKCSARSNERAMRQRAGRAVNRRLTIEEMNEAMGLPIDFDIPCFALEYQYIVRGNGVEIHLGRALARAVKYALEKGYFSKEAMFAQA